MGHRNPNSLKNLRRGGSGRQKGTPNNTTAEVREVAQRLVEDEKYQAKLRERLLEGTLPPAVETLLWHYSYGRPVDRVALSVTERPLSPAIQVHVLSEEVVERAQIPEARPAPAQQVEGGERVQRRVPTPPKKAPRRHPGLQPRETDESERPVLWGPPVIWRRS